MKSENRRTIQNCIVNKQQISIERNEIDDNAITAIPISESEKLLLIEYIYDFNMDGFKVILIDTITSVVRSEVEIFHDKIFKEEGIKSEFDNISDLPIHNWYVLFGAVMHTEKVIDISLGKTEDAFYVGRIIHVNDTFIEFQEISPTGEWDKDTVLIYYDDIIMASFQNRYSQILAKYSRGETCP